MIIADKFNENAVNHAEIFRKIRENDIFRKLKQNVSCFIHPLSTRRAAPL